MYSSCVRCHGNVRHVQESVLEMIVVHTRVRGLHGEGEMRKALDCETREGNRINRVTTFTIQTECYLKGIVKRNKAFSLKIDSFVIIFIEHSRFRSN